jgi:hypothetical protein
MGTFRIRTFPGGPNYSYAFATGATEIWAMHRTDFTKPGIAAPLVTIMIERLNPAPPNFCDFIAVLGGSVTFEIVEHTKAPGCVHIVTRQRNVQRKPRK